MIHGTPTACRVNMGRGGRASVRGSPGRAAQHEGLLQYRYCCALLSLVVLGGWCCEQAAGSSAVPLAAASSTAATAPKLPLADPVAQALASETPPELIAAGRLYALPKLKPNDVCGAEEIPYYLLSDSEAGAKSTFKGLGFGRESRRVNSKNLVQFNPDLTIIEATCWEYVEVNPDGTVKECGAEGALPLQEIKTLSMHAGKHVGSGLNNYGYGWQDRLRVAMKLECIGFFAEGYKARLLEDEAKLRENDGHILTGDSADALAQARIKYEDVVSSKLSSEASPRPAPHMSP